MSNAPGETYAYTSVSYSASICYLKTPLDEMLEARKWLEGIREQRREEQMLEDVFDWDWPRAEPVLLLKG